MYCSTPETFHETSHEIVEYITSINLSIMHPIC